MSHVSFSIYYHSLLKILCTKLMSSCQMTNESDSFVRCKHCKRVFETEDRLQQHDLHSHNYRCEKHDKKFVSKDARDNHFHNSQGHQITAINTKKHKGFKCNQTKNSGAEVQEDFKTAHILQSSYPKRPKVFYQDTELEAHLPTHKTHRCSNSQCATTFHTEAVLSAHFTESHAPKCKMCGFIVDTKENMDTHVKSAHFWRCTKCDEPAFHNRVLLDAHILDIHTLECLHCKEIFDTGSKLGAHMEEKHRDYLFECAECKSVDSLTCPFCASTVSGFDFLNFHEGQLSMAKSFECTKCDKLFDSQNTLSAHFIEAHSLLCHMPGCTGILDSETALLTHYQAAHPLHVFRCAKCHAARVVKCMDCNAHFDNPSVQCSICFSYLKDQIALDNHIYLFHTCSICTVNIKDEAALLEHHSKAHQFKCPDCYEVFECPELLAGHSFGHVFKCGLCRESYATQPGLLAHEESVHPVVVRCLFPLLKHLQDVRLQDSILSLPVTKSCLIIQLLFKTRLHRYLLCSDSPDQVS
jgi:hypothetical protein